MDIHSSITIAHPVDVTFAAFTDGIGSWWPLKMMSFGGDRAKELHLEGKVGGRLYERFTDGEEYTIGTVSRYDAPNRVAFTWKQGNWTGPTTVEVTFTAVPEGTRVDLTHTGWETAGAGSDAAHYGQGWGFILDLFRQSL